MPQTATRLVFSDERSCIQFNGDFDIEENRAETTYHTVIPDGAGVYLPKVSEDIEDAPMAFDESFMVALTDTAVVAAGSVEETTFDPDEDRTLVWAKQTDSEGHQ